MSVLGDAVIIGSGGATASIVLTVTHGATNVSCTTPSGVVLTGTCVVGTDTDVYTFSGLKAYGNYTVSRTLSGDTNTRTVYVDSAEAFEAIISGLPSEYAEVSYIQSSGTQYINTGLLDNNVFKVYADFEFTSVPETWKSIICAELSGSPYTGIGIRSNASNYWSFKHGSVSTLLSVQSLADTRYKITLDDINDTITINDDVYTLTADTVSCTGISIPVFCCTKAGSTYAQYSSAKLYRIKFYSSSNILLGDFVPCIRDSDSAVGMYDIVSNAFFGNSGSGTFLYG